MNTKIIYEAILNMLKIANTRLNLEDYKKLSEFKTEIKDQILENAFLACKNDRPLCQDTGLVVVFLKIGQNVHFEGDFIEDVINQAVRDCYKNNFYRKSTVKDAVFDRKNTGDNTPAIIHTKFQKEDRVSILIGIKGGGAENMTRLKMMNPTSTIDDIMNFALETVEIAGENACPPMTVGIGVGGTAEVAAINAKYALFKGEKINFSHPKVLEAKIVTSSCHIASMPVCINLNCHSLRHIECEIKQNDGNEKIYYKFENYTPAEVKTETKAKKLDTSKIEEFKNLKTGDKILLSGKILTARDMAHKRITETLKKGEKLPFEIENSIIFYAGPCPKKEGEIIGPIGPTTSKRMDNFAPYLYEKGLLATIGKGQRTIKGGNWLYFKATGGVANLYQKCVKSAKLIAYEDLGTEAVYELEVADMPLVVEIL